MGVPTLKAKKERNYRPGRTSKNCGTCDHFVSDFQVVAIGGKFLGIEGRCSLIGLEHGRRYRVLPHYLCDDHDGTKRLKRLRGW